MFLASRASTLLTSRVSSPMSQRAFASSAPAKGGAGLFARLSSFVVGAGVTALATQFYIYQELKDGNKIIVEKQKELEKRLAALEN